jgi:excinuclease UvrABC helicase subunit UvrB
MNIDCFRIAIILRLKIERMNSFDDLVNEFFNWKKQNQTPKQSPVPQLLNEEIAKIISALQNFRKISIDENLGEAIVGQMGSATYTETITEDGFTITKSVWDTPNGQVVRVTKSLEDFSEQPKQTKSLEEQLKDALEFENYELAIELRDKIKSQKKTTNENNSKGRRNSKSKQ